jgi:hypothetical protein
MLKQLACPSKNSAGRGFLRCKQLCAYRCARDWCGVGWRGGYSSAGYPHFARLPASQAVRAPMLPIRRDIDNRYWHIDQRFTLEEAAVRVNPNAKASSGQAAANQ